jgi:hypothetical protein
VRAPPQSHRTGDLLIPFLSGGPRRGEACQYFAAAEDNSDAEQRLGTLLGSQLRLHELEERHLSDGKLERCALGRVGRFVVESRIWLPPAGAPGEAPEVTPQVHSLPGT